MLRSLGVALLASVACRDDAPVAPAHDTLSRALPPTSGAVTLALAGGPLVTVRVGQAVFDVGDPRSVRQATFDGDIEHHPWKWTPEQRILASALDLRDLLTRMICGKDADLTLGADINDFTGLAGCTGVRIEAWTSSADDVDSILVGVPADFNYGSAGFTTPVTAYNREQHLVRTTADGVLALGAGAAGAEAAAWRLARRLGYRWFLPNAHWEIVPEAIGATLQLSRTNFRGGPAEGISQGFLSRRLVGERFGLHGYDQRQWEIRNGFVGGLEVMAIHNSWGRIIDAQPEWFAANPGAISSSSVAQTTEQQKFCPGYTILGGSSLGDYVYETWAKPQLETTDPEGFGVDLTADMLAVHQGEGAYWAGCDPAASGGLSPADRVVTLANKVAARAVVDDILGDRQIGVLAYRESFPGPLQNDLDPNLFVWMIGDGYTGVLFEDALANWQAHGATRIGMYNYWVADPSELPTEGAAQAVHTTAAHLIERLGQGMSALWIEADGGWGANGLFRWLLFDIARRPGGQQDIPSEVVDRYIDDILRAFPTAAQPHIASFLDALDASEHAVLMSPDFIADLYEILGAARAQTIAAGDVRASERVEDLLVYVRYLDLYWRSQEGSGTWDAAVEHAYCTDDRWMTDYIQLWNDGIDETIGTERADYLASHGGLTPAAVMDAAGCPALDFDAWLAQPPTRQIPSGLGWYDGAEESYALATTFPGTAITSTFEQYLNGLPRDSTLWKAWLDPADGVTLTAACHGVLDHSTSSEPPERWHVTSRLLGHGGIEIRNAQTHEVACSVDLPPHREGFDVTFDDAGAVATESPTARGFCPDVPRELALDTGLAEEGVDASCDPLAFSAPGLYEFRILNYRPGLDYDQILGARGLSRWDSPLLALEDRRPAMGNQYRYFYVPLGTSDVVFWNKGGKCKVYRNTNETHHVNLESGRPEYHVVSATTPDGASHAGEIWALWACKDAYIVNLPPVVAPQKDLLMAPCSKVADPAWAPLGLDGSTCL